jgi:hypothetical protein
MTRWKAASIHSGISVLIGVVTGTLMLGVWYPPPYFHAGGADELVLLLVGVDLAVGPLLTLIVFRTGKPGLKFDLFTIGILQSVALVYGMNVVLQARPVFLVAALDRLVLVAADEVTDSDLADGKEPQFRSRSWTGPRLVAARMPTDPAERTDLVFSGLTGRDLQNLPKYYCDFSEGGTSLLPKAKTLDTLFEKHPEARADVERWLSDSGRTSESVVWVPLQASKADLVMLLDKQSARPQKALAIDPW